MEMIELNRPSSWAVKQGYRLSTNVQGPVRLVSSDKRTVVSNFLLTALCDELYLKTFKKRQCGNKHSVLSCLNLLRFCMQACPFLTMKGLVL